MLWGLALGGLVTLAHLLGLLEALELKSVNHRFEVRGIEEPRFPIVPITKDEDSFGNLHLRWPWPRSVHARLLDEIGKGNPREVVELPREYSNTMVPILLKHGGTLDKHVGDAIMGLFGAPAAG